MTLYKILRHHLDNKWFFKIANANLADHICYSTLNLHIWFLIVYTCTCIVIVNQVYTSHHPKYTQIQSRSIPLYIYPTIQCLKSPPNRSMLRCQVPLVFLFAQTVIQCSCRRLCLFGVLIHATCPQWICLSFHRQINEGGGGDSFGPKSRCSRLWPKIAHSLSGKD